MAQADALAAAPLESAVWPRPRPPSRAHRLLALAVAVIVVEACAIGPRVDNDAAADLLAAVQIALGESPHSLGPPVYGGLFGNLAPAYYHLLATPLLLHASPHAVTLWLAAWRVVTLVTVFRMARAAFGERCALFCVAAYFASGAFADLRALLSHNELATTTAALALHALMTFESTGRVRHIHSCFLWLGASVQFNAASALLLPAVFWSRSRSPLRLGAAFALSAAAVWLAPFASHLVVTEAIHPGVGAGELLRSSNALLPVVLLVVFAADPRLVLTASGQLIGVIGLAAVAAFSIGAHSLGRASSARFFLLQLSPDELTRVSAAPWPRGLRTLLQATGFPLLTPFLAFGLATRWRSERVVAPGFEPSSLHDVVRCSFVGATVPIAILTWRSAELRYYASVLPAALLLTGLGLDRAWARVHLRLGRWSGGVALVAAFALMGAVAARILRPDTLEQAAAFGQRLLTTRRRLRALGDATRIEISGLPLFVHGAFSDTGPVCPLMSGCIPLAKLGATGAHAFPPSAGSTRYYIAARGPVSATAPSTEAIPFGPEWLVPFVPALRTADAELHLTGRPAMRIDGGLPWGGHRELTTPEARRLGPIELCGDEVLEMRIERDPPQISSLRAIEVLTAAFDSMQACHVDVSLDDEPMPRLRTAWRGAHVHRYLLPPHERRAIVVVRVKSCRVALLDVYDVHEDAPLAWR